MRYFFFSFSYCNNGVSCAGNFTYTSTEMLSAKKAHDFALNMVCEEHLLDWRGTTVAITGWIEMNKEDFERWVAD
jgi:hypothetical protein